MNKFQRSFRIEIDLGNGDEPIVITSPLTIKFTVTRRYQSSLNTLQLSIHNLGKKLRDAIFQDFYDNRERKTIKFFAGYGNLSLMFSGSIFEASSSRTGTDIVTNIMGKDGIWDIKNTFTYQTIDKGQTIGDVLDFLTAQFTDLEKGAIGDFNDVLERPVVLNGSTYELLKTYSDHKVMIDNNRIYVLNPNEVIDGDYTIIDKNTGILETPKRTEGIIQVVTLFEPRLTVNQKVTLRSEIEPVYNGDYKVIGIVHQGTISEAVGGQCTTVIDMLIPNGQVFKTVQS